MFDKLVYDNINYSEQVGYNTKTYLKRDPGSPLTANLENKREYRFSDTVKQVISSMWIDFVKPVNYLMLSEIRLASSHL